MIVRSHSNNRRQPALAVCKMEPVDEESDNGSAIPDNSNPGNVGPGNKARSPIKIPDCEAGPSSRTRRSPRVPRSTSSDGADLDIGNAEHRSGVVIAKMLTEAENGVAHADDDSTAEETVSEAESETEHSAKRRRMGRPRKTPNATGSDACESGPKRSRGRPRIHPVTSDEPKRKVGRPRKNPDAPIRKRKPVEIPQIIRKSCRINGAPQDSV